MKPRRRNSGNQHLHRNSSLGVPATTSSASFDGYHVFIQAGIICQGLLPVPRRCPSPARLELFPAPRLRTIRPGIPPSELVVATVGYARASPNFS